MRLLFLSCEHGGNEVLPALAPRFKGAARVLASHRGWDIGALGLFQHLRPLAAASASARLSRLCIELNRSEHHPRLFSEFTQHLSAAEKRVLLSYYRTYREGFTASVQAALRDGHDVVHIGVHSFTHVLNGKERDLDIGLLYDPARPAEKHFCAEWSKAIRLRAPGLRVRMNRPYKGTSDGFTRDLRKRFPKGYAGIELEVDQRFAPKGRMHPDIGLVLYASLADLLGSGLS